MTGFAPIVSTALLTGVFCAAFAVLVDAVTDVLAFGAVILVSFCSGFLGSLFAQVVMQRKNQ